ncbi:inhibitor of nuclear factor kappa-B kinase-interacting protein isoform X2 [Pseudorasbora parva]|uniref:inhibitor of nuclear factor kappa-B kinase-interacting protein isoform X2 n=1 Tax=Pseudorasbora parva TaxID=51549 RepID=UPI00351ED4BA
MQTSDLKQRQKSSNKQQNGEKKKKEDENKNEDEKKKKESVDVKLCVSLLCLALSLLVTGLHLQQRATLAEMRGKSRSVEQLDEKLTQVARQLQASAALRLALGSVLNTSAELQMEQDSSSRLLHTLHLRLQSAGVQPDSSHELQALKTQSRGTHGLVTEHINAMDGRLRELSERLQEVQDGSRRNTRVLDRTEEEDAAQVRQLMDGDARRISRVQEQLEQLEAPGLREKLESYAPQAQDEQLAAAEEAVRSMLRVRAHMNAFLRRVQELELQVQSAEDRMREIRDRGRTGSEPRT